MIKQAITTKTFSLALETSGRIGSVAVGCGGILSDETIFSAPMRHSAEIFSTINELLNRFNKKPNQIDNVYISIGPGSFTGVRISVTIAKMMALASDVNIVAVGTSEVMAHNVADTNVKRVASIIDAKRGQFFVAGFERIADSWQNFLPDSLMTAEEFKEQFDNSEKPIALLGEGLLYYADKFATDNITILDKDFWSPRASNVFKVGSRMAEEGKFSDPVE